MGLHLPYWSDLLIKLANVALSGRPRQDLLDNLELKSTEMGTICSRFVELGPGLPIFSLYEKLTTPIFNALVSKCYLEIQLNDFSVYSTDEVGQDCR